MNWSHIKLILSREVRDQLRDRRTLFMIAVLPLLLYPLLGMSFFQVAQFMREQPSRVLVVGVPRLAEHPPLLEGKHFAPQWFSDPHQAQLLELDFVSAKKYAKSPRKLNRRAHRDVTAGPYDAVVYFPPNFAEDMRQYRVRLARSELPDRAAAAVPGPQVFYNQAKERSQLTHFRVSEVLAQWREAIGRQNLEASKLPADAAKPFTVDAVDLAEPRTRKAALWSKVLPFVLLIWSLTGAFYPAVDLCAGEKERGTLETLLCSPAERNEIVMGKLLTVMIFSIITAVLNLVSMGITASFVMRQMPNFGPPPLLAGLWLLLALLPVSALFSALCIALAAFARSTKEGQYYLMPLLLICMPLTILPMAPGVELTLGNSLIPITGVVLLLRVLLEGDYALALPYVIPVVGVTLLCCLFAVRWAADQFNSESVLFRESERWDLGSWLKHLMRDREDTPSVSEAIFCGVLIMLVQFFMSFAFAAGGSLVKAAMVSQIVVIATPALLMTVMLTRSPRKTLLLRFPHPALLVVAPLLALALHPAALELRAAISYMYPLSESMQRELERLVASAGSVWMLLLVGAVPAVCEELAFRGFILSGLRHMGRKWRAIALSSIMFGFTHAVIQQSILATLLGVILAFLAVQSGSLLPGLLFHVTHNWLAVFTSQLSATIVEGNPVLRAITVKDGGVYVYHPLASVVGVAIAIGILVWLYRLPGSQSPEESLQDAITRHQAGSVAA